MTIRLTRRRGRRGGLGRYFVRVRARDQPGPFRLRFGAVIATRREGAKQPSFAFTATSTSPVSLLLEHLLDVIIWYGDCFVSCRFISSSCLIYLRSVWSGHTSSSLGLVALASTYLRHAVWLKAITPQGGIRARVRCPGM